MRLANSTDTAKLHGLEMKKRAGMDFPTLLERIRTSGFEPAGVEAFWGGFWLVIKDPEGPVVCKAPITAAEADQYALQGNTVTPDPIAA